MQAKKILEYYLNYTHRNRIHILVACMPKSGSTYLSEIIANMDDLNRVYTSLGGDRREQELSLEKLIRFNHLNYVAQHHTRYSTPTGKLINTFNIKPVVLVRNIFDIVVSLRDHYHNESVVSPMGYAQEHMLDWDNDKLCNFIIDMVVPWYFNFYLSWQNSNHGYFICYEDLVINPAVTVKKIFEFYSINKSQDEIDIAIEKANRANTRKNKAQINRGNEELSREHREKIIAFASYYEYTNFSMIGIG